MPAANWIPLLRKVFLFSGFPENQLQLIVKKMKLISLPKGAVLFQENDPGDAMFIVARGTIRLTKKGEENKPDTMLAYLNRGDAIGEMSILVGDLHPNTAIVDSTAELLSLSKSDFDELLEKYPSLAVHLSRLLSNRLATIDRGGRRPDSPGKIFSLVQAIPTRDQVVFTMNAAIALAEQTRCKVLCFVISPAPELWAKALGLTPMSFKKEMAEEGWFEDTDRFNRLIMTHPSGVEIAAVEDDSFLASLERSRYSLVSLFRGEYDYVLFSVPANRAEAVRFLHLESNRIAAVTGPHSPQPDIDDIRRLKSSLAPEKSTETIWLSDDSEFFPRDFAAEFKIPWDQNWGRTFLTTGQVYIPENARMTHRMFDRLARSYGQLQVGLAMGSGAAFGYALIGILRILEREGIYPDVVAGTSMGALLGAFYASGKAPDELEAIAQTITRFRLLTQLADFTIPRSGLIKGKAVLHFLKSHLGDRTFQDLLIPFSCVATDIQTGKEIILDKGNVAESVRASLSLPFFFEPAYLDGRYLVDGGLVNPVPTSVTVAQGANILLSANLTLSAGERKVPRLMGWRKRIPPVLRGPSIPEILMKTIYTMQYEISEARSGLADVVMHINAPDLLWWDLDKSEGIIKLGEAAAEENMSKIKSMLPYYSESCKIRLTRAGRKSDL